MWPACRSNAEQACPGWPIFVTCGWDDPSGFPSVPYMDGWIDGLKPAVVRDCDVLLLASPAWVRIFVERHGAQIESKIVVLTNGYDAEETDSIRASLGEADTSVRRFVLTGSMHEAESPLQFIRALGALRRNAPALAAKVRADLIGNGGDNTPRLQAAVHEENVTDLIRLHGPRSHAACIRAQLEADFLFMALAPAHRDTISGKRLRIHGHRKARSGMPFGRQHSGQAAERSGHLAAGRLLGTSARPNSQSGTC